MLDLPLFFIRRFAALLLVLVLLVPAVGHAQDSTDATPAEDSGPELSAALTDPDLDRETLELLVLPLTQDELVAVADAWQGQAKSLTQEVVDLRLELLAAEESTPEADALRENMSQTLSKRNAAFSNLSVAVDNLSAKGGDEAAVAQYRAYRSSIVAVETQKTDWRTLLKFSLDWATNRDGGLKLLIDIGVVIGALLGLLIVARFVRNLSRRSFRRVPNISKLLVAFMAGIVYWLTMAIGAMVVLAALGVNITPLFALVGGATFIIAFAMQDTLGNLAAGVMIIINRPFDEGDYVTVAGVGGTVQAVSIVSTTVTTPDNQVIVIPNSKVWGDIITNVTASETRRVDLVFGIGYDDSIATAQSVLERVTSEHPLILSDPAPVIRVNELADSSVNFICRPWVRGGDYWTVYWDLTRQMKEAFDAENISIPFPQTDMHLHLNGQVPMLPRETKGPVAGEGRPAGAPDFATGDATD